MLTTTRSLLLTLAAVGIILSAATTAHAKATPAQACAATKNKAAGKYAACLQTAAGTFAANGDTTKFTTARGKCRDAFLKAWAKADAKAAKAGATCGDAPLTVNDFDASVDTQSAVLQLALAGQGLRSCGDTVRAGSEQCDGPDLGGETCVTQGFALGTLRCASGCLIDTSGCFATRYTDNGDGTVADHQTGLQWEKKDASDGSADLANPHDVDNLYTWAAGGGGTSPDGTLFTNFLPKLNGVTTNDELLTGCFADHCDWRVPTVVELQTILLQPDPCGTSPCIDAAFGPTVAFDYWSATTYLDITSAFAEDVLFTTGSLGTNYKSTSFAARAVRTGP